jgi:hypothetical protein
MPIRLTRPANNRPSFDKDEHEDHLCLFVHPTPETMSTRYGDCEAARCDYAVDVDTFEAYTDVVLFGAALVPRLVDADDGAVVVGRLVRGVPKAGQSPPWLLEDPTDKDLADGQAFVDMYATQAKSGAISLDLKAIERGRTVPSVDEQF